MIADSNYYAGTVSDGIYRFSKNSGTWTAIKAGLPESTTVNAVLAKGTLLFAATKEKGIYTSENNGTSWAAANNGLPDSLIVYDLAWSGKYVIAGTSKMFYRSADNGATWTAAYGGIKSSVVSVASCDSMVIALAASSGVYVSLDSGTTFTNVLSKYASSGGSCVAINKGGAFYGSGLGLLTKWYNPLMKSWRWQDSWDLDTTFTYYRNGNANWIKSPDDTTNVYVATPRGIYMGWWKMPLGLSRTATISDLTVFDGKLVAATGNEAYSSADNGSTWKSAGLENDSVIFLVSNATDLYAGTKRDIFRKTDTTWTIIDTGLPSGFTLSSLASSGPALITGGAWLTGTGALSGGTFRTVNNGKTWDTATAGFSANAKRSYFFTVNGTCTFSRTDDGVYRSLDNGSTWAPAISGLTDYSSVVTMASTSGNVFAGTFSAGSFSSGFQYYNGAIYKTSNNGDDWAEIYSENYVAVTKIAAADGFVFAREMSAGTYANVIASYSSTARACQSDGRHGRAFVFRRVLRFA